MRNLILINISITDLWFVEVWKLQRQMREENKIPSHLVISESVLEIVKPKTYFWEIRKDMSHETLIPSGYVSTCGLTAYVDRSLKEDSIKLACVDTGS